MIDFKRRALNFKKIITLLTFFIVMFICFSNKIYAKDNLLDEVKNIVKNYYVYDIDEKVIGNANSIEDILKSLNDPYTVYFSRKQYKNFMGMVNKKYSDIGISMDIAQNGIKVVSVLDGSPAYKAGILPEDILLEVNGRSMEGINVDMAMEYIKGEEGTAAHIKILRDNKFIEFDILRKQTYLPTVDGRIFDGHIGYIKISTFGKNTFIEFENILSNMKEAKVDNYIVDLRFNPGGYLQSAIDLAGYFVGEDICLITKDKVEGETKYYSYASEVINKPIIFLVNEYSASAAEVLIAAVKDYNKALIVGSKTYGKGLVQSIFNLSDGSVLKMSVKTFYSPKKNVINKVGIKPDIRIKDVDALKTALFLIQNPMDKLPKKGYQLLKLYNKSFEVDVEKLKKLHNWEIYQNLIANNDVQLFNEYKNGWNKIYDFRDKPYTIFYPNYKHIGNISDAHISSSFNVNFPRNFSKLTVNNNNIELISLSSGNKIPANVVIVNSKSIKIVPNKELKKGQCYFLLINPGVKDFNNKSIGGTLTYITVI